MKIGTAEPLDVERDEKKKTRPSTLSPAGGSSGKGNNGKSGGGGGNGPGGKESGEKIADPYLLDAEGEANASIQKYRISMWAVLLAALMTFAGLMAAYIMLATNPQLEWRPFDLPFQLWISTALILISSVTYEFGKNNLRSGHQIAARNWLVTTNALGAIFIGSQLMAWIELVNRGVYMTGNPYAGFFYVLTAAHALHVFGGMGALGYVLLKIWHPTSYKEVLVRRSATAQISGWFWHFLGAIWVVLFALIGFWK